MKFCNCCGTEIFTRDGENTCRTCEDAQDAKQKCKLAKAKMARNLRESLLADCGLVKVRGALGDTYDETLMYVHFRGFRVGDWGTIVERGNYA